MSIADVKSGGWVTDEQLSPDQMNLVRSELLKCVDGVGGGTYTPSTTIDIDDLRVGGTNRLKYGSRQIPKTVALAAVTAGAFGTPPSAATNGLTYVQTVDGTTLAYFALDLPSTGTLDSVIVTLDGAAGHAGALGSTPAVFVYRRLASATTIADTWTTSDTLATTSPSGAYESPHPVTVTVGAALTGGYQWFVGVRGESGANYVAGLAILSIVAWVTFTEQPEW